MNEGLFKTALNGFKKADVLHFIDDLDSSHRKKEQELNSQIEKLTAELKEKSEANSKLESDLQGALNESAVQKTQSETLEVELHSARGSIDELQLALQGRGSEIDELRGELLSAQQKIKIANDEVYEKDRRINDLLGEMAEQQATLQKLNKTEDQIGRVMLEARSMADKTVEDARRVSEGMLSTAGERVQTLAEGVGDFKSRVVSLHGTTKEFLEMSQRMLEQIEVTAESIEHELHVMADIESSGEEDPAENSETEEGSEVQGDAPFCEAAAAGPGAGDDEQDCAGASSDGEQY